MNQQLFFIVKSSCYKKCYLRMALYDRLTLLLITFAFYWITNAELVTKPTDTEAVVDDLTYFNCSTSITSEAIQWFHFRVGNNEGRNLVYGYDQFYNEYKNDRFTVEKNEATGTYNLVIRSVQIQDAGRFECQDDVGRGAKASARLIVLEQSPVCQSNHKTNEVIGPNVCNIPLGELQLTCSATYHGDESPVLKWLQDGSDEALVDGISFSTAGNRFLTNLTLKAESIKNGSSYKCQTTRSKPEPRGCNTGSFTIIGVSTFPEPEKTSCGAAIAFIVILILIIITGIVLVVLYLRKPSVFKIFNRQDGKKDVEKDGNKDVENQNAGIDDSVAIGLLEKYEVLEIEEPVVMPEMSAKLTQDENEHYEKLRKRLSRALNSIEQKDKIIDELKKGNEQLRKNNKQLEDEKHELEDRLYRTAITGDYVKPTLVATIEINDLKAEISDPKPGSKKKKKKKPIFGMTILHKKLCIITEKSSEVAVYDSVTFKSEASWHIDGMSNPQDITSCSINDCLYICDGEPDNEKLILRVDSNKTVLNKWTIERDEGRLSVTREANVVVSLFNGNKINEYTPNGDLIRTVRLSPADNISHPWHAIKTTSMHFLFSHGIGDDQLQRVCVADVDGKIRKSFGGKKGSEIKEQQMNRPVHLLEDSSRNILVADMKNKRVFLLSPSLELKGMLVSAENGDLKFPMRLCLDEEKGILFVADNNYKEKQKVDTYHSGRILIFNCKKKQRK